MSDNDWLTVADVSEKIGIPVETIRRYIRNHSHHLKVRKLHKKYQLHDECVTVIEQIRELYSDGKSIDEVDRSLAASGVQLTINVEPEEHDRNRERDDRIEKQLLAMKTQLEQQQEFNHRLLERLDQQQKYIDNRLEDRDRKLMESIRQLQEEKKARLEAAASQEEEQTVKKGFWGRLFGK
ncbi:hypothetical protein HMPREF3291_00200 [Bacillus sp. HMSC76G11]|uniref:MerR family transcriptional regulator n=1 Tax=Metabacillus idriensis TaxID=324768 RepID=A0A6I2MKC9_9BACI|nr:MerR family transcriptional regulator [Metabacillus idriensis]MRX57071.1 MerR family transcriptional regulator [Metabacillus idriensis]OHR71175.1 hypothetical protein HMPREF3291_00200 [Bacillus sp. HMSC76G11]